jgi:hypothetical protein
MMQRRAEASALQIDEAAWNGYGRRRPFGTLMSRGRAREIFSPQRTSTKTMFAGTLGMSQTCTTRNSCAAAIQHRIVPAAKVG